MLHPQRIILILTFIRPCSKMILLVRGNGTDFNLHIDDRQRLIISNKIDSCVTCKISLVFHRLWYCNDITAAESRRVPVEMTNHGMEADRNMFRVFVYVNCHLPRKSFAGSITAE